MQTHLLLPSSWAVVWQISTTIYGVVLYAVSRLQLCTPNTMAMLFSRRPCSQRVAGSSRKRRRTISSGL